MLDGFMYKFLYTSFQNNNENLPIVLLDSCAGNKLGNSLAIVTTTDASNGYIAPYNDEGSSRSRIKMKLKEFHESTASFTALNRNYLTPFFKSRSGDDEEDDNSKNDLNSVHGFISSILCV
uniref:Uncharacterized protein n=1 Tax=Cucumis sativus TaxID=3659 RepID=A0A0A0LW39_CUCSA